MFNKFSFLGIVLSVAKINRQSRKREQFLP